MEANERKGGGVMMVMGGDSGWMSSTLVWHGKLGGRLTEVEREEAFRGEGVRGLSLGLGFNRVSLTFEVSGTRDNFVQQN